MKYAIKVVTTGSINSYAHRNSGNTFSYTSTLEEATLFDTIREAVEALLLRATEGYHDVNFTIVGAKEITVPRFEEVVL